MAAYCKLRLESQRTGIQEEKKKEAKLDGRKSNVPANEMREELPENLNQQENLSDQNQEEENQLSEFVSRLDYEALQSQNAQLQRRLEILAQNMMSPDYVQYLEAKRMASMEVISNLAHNPNPNQNPNSTQIQPAKES